MDFIDKQKKLNLTTTFYQIYQQRPSMIVRSSGRMELLGNHTDHQGGKVLVAAINLFMYAAFVPRSDLRVNVVSKGFPKFSLELTTLVMQPEETFTSQALIRGIASRLNALRYQIGGLDLYIESDVPPGSGVSSSAAFEMLMVEVFNVAFNQRKILPIERAKIGQFSENHFFGKPSGLLDQMGVSLGGINYINFQDRETVAYETMSFPFSSLAFLLIDTGGDHANLTNHYQAIRTEMESVARSLGGQRLADLDPKTWRTKLQTLPISRATRRALHYFEENERVEQAKTALKLKNQALFLQLLNQSGISSETLLENITFPNDQDRRLDGALRKIRNANLPLAVRVHGGGFAGTILISYDKKDTAKIQDFMIEHFGSQKMIPVIPIASPILSEEI